MNVRKGTDSFECNENKSVPFFPFFTENKSVPFFPVSLHKKNKHLISSYLSSPDSPSGAFNEDGKPVLFNYPRRQGIGTAAFKKLDSSVVGDKSLRKYIDKVDRDESIFLDYDGDYRATMQAKYVRIADELLRSLNE